MQRFCKQLRIRKQASEGLLQWCSVIQSVDCWFIAGEELVFGFDGNVHKIRLTVNQRQKRRGVPVLVTCVCIL